MAGAVPEVCAPPGGTRPPANAPARSWDFQRPDAPAGLKYAQSMEIDNAVRRCGGSGSHWCSQLTDVRVRACAGRDVGH